MKLSRAEHIRRYVHIKHGLTHSPTYHAWDSMVHRARGFGDAKTRRNYRGRGVCLRWLNFANFLADMGQRPTPAHSLDRIDNERGYECGACVTCRRLRRRLNCRWATRAQQARNTRRNNLITIRGRTMCITDWAAEAGIHIGTLRCRLRNGWPIEAALATPRLRSRWDSRSARGTA